MTSTHTFQGLESDSKPSSRVLKPPGGGSSSIFGNSEDAAPSSRPHKMTSNIFGSKPEADNVPKRSNPPGGKTSGIFQDPAPVQPAAQRQNPPGGKTSDIFGDAKLATSPKAHPNKPRDNISLKQPEVNNVTPVKAEQPPPPPPAPTPEPTPEVKIPVKTPVAKEEKVVVPEVDMSKHEPHLGPKPRSHNRVLNPPGGKSSITFY